MAVRGVNRQLRSSGTAVGRARRRLGVWDFLRLSGVGAADIEAEEETISQRNRLQRNGSTSSKLADVAERAGVSTASVSRVLNHPDKVSEALRRRVRAALDELAYVPHGPARALASQRSHTIGTVVPTLGIGVFAEGVEALQRCLDDRSYTLLVAASAYDLRAELQQVRALVERGVDGIALVGGYHLPEVYGLLERQQVPYVNTYVHIPDSPHPSIGMDNRGASYRLVKTLLDLGHRHFGIITSPTYNNDRISDRVAGILRCLTDHGIGLEAPGVLEVPYSISDGRLALRSLLEANPRITAVPCTTDALAIGALLEARRLGIAVPEALSVTGFDDLDIAAQVDPPLTTVHVPAEELGSRIASYLLDRIEGKPVPHNTELAVNLIIRGSAGRPAA